MLYRSHQPTSVPTGRPSNRVGPAFRRLENRSRTYEKRRQHRSHRSWPTEREPMPPSEPLSFTLFPRSSPSFLPSLPLLLISSIPPLPPSFPYLCVPPYICRYISIYIFSLSDLSPPPSVSLLSSLCFCIPFQRVFARSPSTWPPPCFESPLYRAAPAITTHACHTPYRTLVTLRTVCCLCFADILFSSHRLLSPPIFPPLTRSLAPFSAPFLLHHVRHERVPFIPMRCTT